MGLCSNIPRVFWWEILWPQQAKSHHQLRKHDEGRLPQWWLWKRQWVQGNLGSHRNRQVLPEMLTKSVVKIFFILCSDLDCWDWEQWYEIFSLTVICQVPAALILTARQPISVRKVSADTPAVWGEPVVSVHSAAWGDVSVPETSLVTLGWSVRILQVRFRHPP